MKLLIVIDMQNDFIDGALGSAMAQAVVEPVRQRILQARAAGDRVIFTRDTHGEDYLTTQEGRNLPVPHCIRGTQGWEISPLLPVEDAPVVDKPTFGSLELPRLVAAMPEVEEIELVGVCTDICVISNAMVLKAAFPEIPLSVRASCCAGVTEESHLRALGAMGACQIGVLD